MPKLNAQGAEIAGELVNASELKVGKMEDALTVAGVLDIDQDKDRFYVRIPGGANLKNVSIKLATIESPNPNYNDHATEIEMIVDGNDLITKSMLLVSDNGDDDYSGNGVGVDEEKNDRTHKVQLGGKVQIKSITINGTEHQIDMKTDVPAKKKIDVTVVVLSVNGNRLVGENEVRVNLEEAEQRFAQVGVEINWDVQVKAAPTGINLTNGFDVFEITGNAIDLAAEARTLVDQLGTNNDTTDMHVYFVGSSLKKITDGTRETLALAVSLYDSFMSNSIPARTSYSGNLFLGNEYNSYYYVLAHELGHLLTDNGHYGVEYGDNDPLDDLNLMRYGPSSDRSLNAGKRLKTEQETTIHENERVDDL